MSLTSFCLTISSTTPTTDRLERRNQTPILTSWAAASRSQRSRMATRSARSYRVWAPVRDGRRRLRPWTVTQPWTPRTRPPLLGKRADAFPTLPTAVHRLGKSKKRDPRLRAGRNQTILMAPTAWPLFRRSSVAAFERSVTVKDHAASRAVHTTFRAVGNQGGDLVSPRAVDTRLGDIRRAREPAQRIHASAAQRT